MTKKKFDQAMANRSFGPRMKKALEQVLVENVSQAEAARQNGLATSNLSTAKKLFLATLDN